MPQKNIYKKNNPWKFHDNSAPWDVAFQNFCIWFRPWWGGGGTKLNDFWTLKVKNIFQWDDGEMMMTVIATGSGSAFLRPVLWVCNIVVQIWICGSIPLTYRSVSRFGSESGSGSGSAF
jgi:hypothetical protein